MQLGRYIFRHRTNSNIHRLVDHRIGYTLGQQFEHFNLNGWIVLLKSTNNLRQAGARDTGYAGQAYTIAVA